MPRELSKFYRNERKKRRQTATKKKAKNQTNKYKQQRSQKQFKTTTILQTTPSSPFGRSRANTVR
jgi:hypothetical protein